MWRVAREICFDRQHRINTGPHLCPLQYARLLAPVLAPILPPPSLQPHSHDVIQPHSLTSRASYHASTPPRPGPGPRKISPWPHVSTGGCKGSQGAPRFDASLKQAAFPKRGAHGVGTSGVETFHERVETFQKVPPFRGVSCSVRGSGEASSIDVK